MIRTFAKQLVSSVLSFLLVIATTPLETRAQQSAPEASPGYSGQGAPLSAEELQQITAPIALYPDALVAQILGAATFPDQVAFAANWLHQNSSLTGKALLQAVDQQTLGSQCEGAHPISLGARRPGEKPQPGRPHSARLITRRLPMSCPPFRSCALKLKLRGT